MAEWEPERPCSYEGKEEPPARRLDSLGHQPDPTWEPPCVLSPYPHKGLFVCQALITSSPMIPTGPCTHTRTYAHCTLGHTGNIRMTYIQTLALLQLDGRAASIHHPLTSDPDPQTCTSCPAFLELRVGVRVGLGPVWLLEGSPHPTHAQPPARCGRAGGPSKKRNEGQNGPEGHPCLAPGPKVGSGRRQRHPPCWASKSDGGPVGPPEGLRTLGRGTVVPTPKVQVRTVRRRR